MRNCHRCGVINPEVADVCEYCGGYFNREYRLFAESRNSLRKVRFGWNKVVYPFDKHRELSSKIDDEAKRIREIRSLMANVRDAEMLARISGILGRLESYLESLIRYKIDIEYYGIRLSARNAAQAIAIGSESDTDSIMRSCEKLRYQFTSTLEEANRGAARAGVREYIESKRADLGTLLENISLSGISSILSSTTIVPGGESDVTRDYSELERNIEAVKYEIDRISAEFSLEA